MKRMIAVLVVALMGSAAARAVDFDTRAYLSTRSEVFVSGQQRFVTAKNRHSDVDKAKAKPTAVALGYQYSIDQWSVGLSASFEQFTTKSDYDVDGFNKFQDRTFGFTLFGKYNFCDGGYVKGSAFVGIGRDKGKGHLDAGTPFTTGRSESATRFGASLELGKAFDFDGGFRLTPHVGFDYSYFPSRDIEFGSGGAWPNRSQNFYEVPLGVTFAKDFVTCDWVITPSVDLTLISSIGNMKNENMNDRIGFASRTGSEWKTYGIGAGHWGGRVTAGIRAVKSERFDIDVNYAYEGRKKYNDHRIGATIGFGF